MSTTIFAYILASSSNPDKIDCVVPWRVNENEIFFGPCKKRLRAYLRKEYLKEKEEVNVYDKNLYILGFNGGNSMEVRKIVWLGKIVKLCTFKKAFQITQDEQKYFKMLTHKFSPLNLEPVFDLNNEHYGYKIRSEEHKKGGAWLSDFTSKPRKNFDKSQEDYIFSDRDIKDRDICIFLENLHFAKDCKGIEINSNILNSLKNSQPENNDINKYCVFGKTKNGKARGLAGGFLKIQNSNAEELIDCILKTKNSDESNSK